MPRFYLRSQRLAPLPAEVRSVDRTRDTRVAVPEKIPRLFRVVAVHRCRVAQRVKVRERRQLLARHAAQDVGALVVYGQMAVLIDLEQLRERRRALRGACSL
jgi:hypothetical protein